jgi:hypothetical protein
VSGTIRAQVTESALTSRTPELRARREEKSAAAGGSRRVDLKFTLVCYANSNDGIPIEELRGDAIDLRLTASARGSPFDPQTWIPDSRFAASAMKSATAPSPRPMSGRRP